MDTFDHDFMKIYETYHPRLLRYLTRLVGAEEAEDLSQEVFIKAGQALPGFRGASSLATWLYRIATNTAYDKLRSQSFHEAVRDHPWDEPIEDNEEEIAGNDPCRGEGAPLVEQQIVKKEMGECILGYAARLPEGYRAVLLLSDLEGLSNKAIAEILGVTLGTVKIRLHRARAMLRELILSHCEYYWVSELSWRAA